MKKSPRSLQKNILRRRKLKSIANRDCSIRLLDPSEMKRVLVLDYNLPRFGNLISLR